MEYEDFEGIMKAMPDCEMTKNDFMAVFHSIMCVYGMDRKNMISLLIDMIGTIAEMDEANILETDELKLRLAQFERLH